MKIAVVGLMILTSTCFAKGLDEEFRQRQNFRTKAENQEQTSQAYGLAQSRVEAVAGSRVISGPTKQKVWSTYLFYYKMENGFICRISLDPPMSNQFNGFNKPYWSVGPESSVVCE